MSSRGGYQPGQPYRAGSRNDHQHATRSRGTVDARSSGQRLPQVVAPSNVGIGGLPNSIHPDLQAVESSNIVSSRLPPPPIGTPSFQNQGTFRYILGIDEPTPLVPESPYHGSYPAGPPIRPLGPIGERTSNYSSQVTQNWQPMARRRSSGHLWDQDFPISPSVGETVRQGQRDIGNPPIRVQPQRRPNSMDDLEGPPPVTVSQRRPANRDEFDGPHQLLNRPAAEIIAAQERDLPHLPTNLFVQEQDDVLAQVNTRLSNCAFDFIAKYQFPIPLEPDKRPVAVPGDREWTEWVFLLKRLATKRRIPARVLYNNQIKQLVTVLENSLEMRHAAKHQSRPLKDDRNVLQLISAGIQVAKMLKDAGAMEYLDRLYVSTEQLIQNRKSLSRFPM
ncbi:MAG: hypothetical protein M1812_000616 [Candelaria pacifica]|nr:MAG: hypothetical protein M1812_000616 [Candelaria pacifica]